MKGFTKAFLILFAVLFLFTTTAADEIPNQISNSAVATEYADEGLFEDFETDSQPVSVPTSGDALSLSCSSAILMEASSGTILYEKNANEKRSPASITKVMTLLLTMEAVENGKISLNDNVTCSAHAAGMGGSQIWLEENETMTVNELLKAVCVASANDAATALGEFIAGSEEGFVAMMNARAKELKMDSTHFVNCCGLDAEGHTTTAHDIGIMSCCLLKHELIKKYSMIWIDYLRGGKTQLVNTNKLVRFFEGSTGLKTGTTDKAGFCVSATALRGGMELTAVVLNGKTSDLRFSDAKALLNYGFANFEISKTDLSELDFGEIPITHGIERTVKVEYETPKTMIIKKGNKSGIETKITLPGSLEAPVGKGQIIGKVTFILDNEEIGVCRLTAATDVDKINFFSAFFKLFSEVIRM